MENELILKLDKETTLPLIESLGKSAYAIAVAHGFRGTEQEWLDSLKGPKGEPGTKGDPFRYEDFTPEQLESLKGPKGDAGTGSNVDLSAYTTKKEAENLYLKKVDIRSYLTMLGDPKYALKTDLNNYMPTATFRDTFVSRPYADNTYAKKTDLNNYVSKTDAETSYSKKSELNKSATVSPCSSNTCIPAGTVSPFFLNNEVSFSFNHLISRPIGLTSLSVHCYHQIPGLDYR